MYGLNGWSQSAGYRLGREHKPDAEPPPAPPVTPVEPEVDIHGDPPGTPSGLDGPPNDFEQNYDY